MDALGNIPQIALLILVVIVIFNIIIFVHELGHYWAAKWRGLQIDRFQIWFGKPIWSKTINGVQYGMGWIPAGGFVALPQMAPMEAIEGGNLNEKPLPPITPLDKIIVAFAGPLFSFMLAVIAAFAVWKVGKPADFIPSQTIGEIVEDSPAETAGLQVGDRITHINGEVVDGWAGKLNSVTMMIITSKGDTIDFTVERDGQPMEITSGFEIEERKFWQRGGLRQVGIGVPTESLYVAEVSKGSPAEKAGLITAEKLADRVVSIDGREFTSAKDAVDYIKERGTQPITFEISREKGSDEEARFKTSITPVKPVQPEGKDPMIGVLFTESPEIERALVYPTPGYQIKDTLNMMWVTIDRVVSSASSLGIGHLSGPVGIANIQYQYLQMDHPWKRILGFMVLLNVNLAILNMLPLPVLDGGHITLAIMEWIARRPVRAKFLEWLQVGFAMLLFSIMIYVSTKDVGDIVSGGGGGSETQEIVWPSEAN